MTRTFLRTSELTTPSRNTDRNRFLHTIVFLLGFLAAMIAAEPASAQYSCFPTCSDVDARFLSIAGTNLSTLSNSEVVMKIGSPGVATTVEIGIFDGETGGRWDYGTTPLVYTLFADPTGAGTGTTQVASWNGSQMLDNQWTSFTVNNPVGARAANGNYLYRLVITTSDPLASYTSNFKVRTSGTVALRAQAFTVTAAAITSSDLNVIYPAGWSNVTPSTPTTYDGTFNFYLDVLTKESSLSVWDGDMDHGSFDCSVRDVDDINTSNFVLPPWANALSANLEGVGFGDPCALGGGRSTGTPPDDFSNARFRRSPVINYDVITPGPNGETFNNANPSGSKEWEQFRIATGPIDNIANDAHADSLPAGIYQVRVNGMDISNLNGWRFFSDVLGIDADGDPVPPLRPYTINGVVCLIADADTDEDDDHSSCSHDDDDDNGGSKSKSKSKSSHDDDDDDDNGGSKCKSKSKSKSKYSSHDDDDDNGGSKSKYSSHDDDDDNGSKSKYSSHDDDDDNGGSKSKSKNSHDDDDDNGGSKSKYSSHDNDDDNGGSRCSRRGDNDDNDGRCDHDNGDGGCSHDDEDDDSAPGSSDCGTTLEDVEVVLVGDINGDGVNDVVRTTTTDNEGRYSFPDLEAGSYRVHIVTSTLPSGAEPDSDYDGVATPNTAKVVIASGGANPGSVYFRYSIDEDAPQTGTIGVRTQGYWKNHANNWPMTSIMIGCKTYSRADAIKIMKTSVSGDKTYSMFYQLVAAKLNVAAGARSSCIASVISAAESWMCSNKLGSNVSGSSKAWTNSGSALHYALDEYNNGNSCAPHVD